MDIKLYVAMHKKADVPKDPLYIPIQVNAADSEAFLETRDNQGDNISSLNDEFSELTALYYIYKNTSHDYTGLVHYRRYLSLKGGKDLSGALTEKEAEELLKRYKILLPKKRHYYIETIYSHYAHTFTPSHLDRTREIIKKMHPDSLSSFDEVMRSRSAYMFNMYLMRKDLHENYCSWLFPILFELRKEIDTSSMTAFEKRYAGRISERLFNVWLLDQMKNGIIKKEDLHELPYIYLGKEPWGRKIISFLMAKFFHKQYKESF